jgi:opacity protein-like surface antigen
MLSRLLILVLFFLLFVSAGARDDDEEEEPAPEEERFFLPVEAYPVVEVFGGLSKGITYRDGVYHSAKRAARAGNTGELLEDIGETYDYGGTVRYVFYSRFDFSISLFHQMGRKHETVYRYDYSVLDPYVKPPQYVEEYVSYKANNLDYKIRAGFEPFPDFFVTPYVAFGLGGNYMQLTVRNYMPGKKTPLSFFYPGNDTVGHFSFDYAVYGGIHINFTDNLYIFGEAFFDRPFSNHYYFEYLLETGSTGFHGGVAVRLR